jgi:hypothetical protein
VRFDYHIQTPTLEIAQKGQEMGLSG